MNKKLKRTLIGCVLPLFITAIACGIVFYQNAAAAIFGKPEKGPVKEGTITLNMGNWEEYFEYVEEYIYEKNDNGEVEKVRLFAYYKMKEEYYERLASSSEDVILMVDVDDTFKEYQITDSATGEWELTGNDSKYESDFYQIYLANYQGEREMCWWDADTNRCEVSGHGFWDEVPDEKIVQQINDVTVRAAQGEITFK